MQIKGLENKMQETHTLTPIRKIIKSSQVFERYRDHSLLDNESE